MRNKPHKNQTPFPTAPIILLCASILSVLIGAVLSILGLDLIFTVGSSGGYVMLTIGAASVTVGTVLVAASGKVVVDWVIAS